MDQEQTERTTDGESEHGEQRGGLTRRRWLSLSAAAGTAVAGLPGATAIASASGRSRRDVVIESHDGIDIVATVYRPAGADADSPVPMILHSHGWSGSRTSSAGAFPAELSRGFGVLSFDQRGHGDSGGMAYVQSPEREGRDVVAVLDYVEGLDWVRRSTGGPAAQNDETPQVDREQDGTRKNDPMVFAMGRSYGGAYQLVGALTETELKGYTRFDALAPQITWFDLSDSLAPENVVRSTWVSALYAAGASMVPEHIHRGFAYGAATGQWPNGDTPGEPDLESRFFDNGPSGFVAGFDPLEGAHPSSNGSVQLDVPVLFGQGLTDNLFNLNQAWHNFEEALTDRAREKSAVIGYNGGHALPNVLPLGMFPSPSADDNLLIFADQCSGAGGFDELRLRFFEAVRDGTGDARSLAGSPYSLTTADGSRCVQVDSLDDRRAFGAGVDLTVRGDGEGGLAVVAADDGGTTDGGGTAVTTTGVGAPVYLELSSGPLTVAGVPTLSATVTTFGIDQRVFAALAVGESPATAQVVQNNVMPLREPDPVTDVKRTIELPGVAVDATGNEQLYLVLSAVSDMFPAHGSIRTPGVILLEDLTVHVPLTDDRA